MKKVLFYSVVTSLFLSSCAPKIITNVIKQYPTLDKTEKFVVYEREKDDKVPKNAETIGKFSVVENGFTVGGSYEEVVELASDRTKEYGGNALLITDHIEPSIFVSSIHQIGGLMLRVDENNTGEMVSSKDVYTSAVEESRKNYIAIPTHILSLNMGYGNVYNRTDGLRGAEKDFEDIMSQGISWNAKYSYHHKGSIYGFGLIYSQFHSNFFKDVEFYSLSHSARVDYFGIIMSLRYHFSPKWIYNTEFGFGYLGMDRKVSDGIEAGHITASNIGVNIGAGVSYKINKHWGIGVDLSAISGSFSSVKYDNLTPDPNAPELDNEHRLGVSRFNIETGLRYYF